MPVKTTKYADLGLEDPVAVIGFPSIGLVSSIMANHYVSQLSMEPIAGLSSPSMPPYCMIQNGTAYPPVRLYGRKRTTKGGRDAIVCLSEYAPKPEDCYEVVEGILSYLRYAGVKDVVCLEGIGRSSDEDVPLACGSGERAAKMIRKSKFRVMGSGMVKGTTGVMLHDAVNFGMSVAALLAPANPSLPDPGSAAVFIPAVASIAPGMRVSPKILMEEDAEIKRHMESVSAGPDPSESAAFYG